MPKKSEASASFSAKFSKSKKNSNSQNLENESNLEEKKDDSTMSKNSKGKNKTSLISNVRESLENINKDIVSIEKSKIENSKSSFTEVRKSLENIDKHISLLETSKIEKPISNVSKIRQAFQNKNEDSISIEKRKKEKQTSIPLEDIQILQDKDDQSISKETNITEEPPIYTLTGAKRKFQKIYEHVIPIEENDKNNQEETFFRRMRNKLKFKKTNSVFSFLDANLSVNLVFVAIITNALFGILVFILNAIFYSTEETSISQILWIMSIINFALCILTIILSFFKFSFEYFGLKGIYHMPFSGLIFFIFSGIFGLSTLVFTIVKNFTT